MGQSLEYTFLFFGASRDLIAASQIPQSWPEGTKVSDIRMKLNSLVPALIPMNYAIAINEVYALDDQLIPDGAQVAILPPVSGG